jgi:hypothetical protein
MQKLQEMIAELKIGRRGFISVPSTSKELGLSYREVQEALVSSGFQLEKHGKYGFCAFRPGA